jgi:uncharacterized protein (UPF0128 family)
MKARVNGIPYGFTFDYENGKASNGYFNAVSTRFIDDVVAEYGADYRLREIIDNICANIKLYHIVLEETTCYEHVFEAFGINDDDAKHNAICGIENRGGKKLSKTMLASEQKIIACSIVE